MTPLHRLKFAFALGLVSSSGLLANESQPPFRDVTDAVGLDFVHFNGMTGRLYYPEVVGSGGALFDADGDGDLDLYLVQGALLGADRTLADALHPWPSDEPPRDRLFRNDLVTTDDGRRTLRFVDVTEESGIRSTGYGMGAAVGDVDGDGDLDLLVLEFGTNQLWLNEGRGPGEPLRFTNATERSGLGSPLWSVAATFADFDADGQLDLFVANYLDYSIVGNKQCLTERGEPDYCLPSTYRPQRDLFYLGRGDATFVEASHSSGVDAAPANGLGVIAADLDGDHDIDAYVANDLMPNQLWLNQGPPEGASSGVRFVDDSLMFGAAVSGEGKPEASMGIELADVDADGDLDLFLTHYRRESNTLYRAEAGGFFSDHSGPSGLGSASWQQTGFGVASIDYDRDGDLDMAVANGAVTFVPGIDRTKDPFPLQEPNQLFRNRGDGTFEDLGDAAGADFRGDGVSRGLLAGDLDNDGRIDLVITNNSGPARVLLNQTDSVNDWLGVHILPEVSAMGAVAELIESTDNSRLPRQRRRVQRDGSYASAKDPRIVFASDSDSPLVEITWPGGQRERFGPLANGRYHQLRRGAGTKVSAP